MYLVACSCSRISAKAVAFGVNRNLSDIQVRVMHVVLRFILELCVAGKKTSSYRDDAALVASEDAGPAVAENVAPAAEEPGSTTELPGTPAEAPGRSADPPDSPAPAPRAAQSC